MLSRRLECVDLDQILRHPPKERSVTDIGTELVNIAQLKIGCSGCSLRELCLPIGLAPMDMQQLDQLVTARRKLKRGAYIYQTNQPFHALYAIRVGFFKTFNTSADGREQVTGFYMPGELLGMDAISADIHSCDAMALEDSELCEIPFTDLERLSRDIPALQHQFHKIMSREIMREHGLMMLLGNMRAEERLATFLLNLSQRFKARGFSAHRFHLRMTRNDIGLYLGLKLETVSRMFSKFRDEGILRISNKYLEIDDIDALRRLAQRDECALPTIPKR